MTGFDPDGSLVDATWAAVLLSERDVAGQIPINFVTNPAVSLRAACFGNNVFEYDSAVRCISNLLVDGFRRIIVDLYWSPDRRLWTFCPVEIPLNEAVVTVSSTISATATSGIAPTTATTASATAGAQATVVSNSSGSLLYELGPYLCSKDLDVTDLVDIFVGYFRDTTSSMSVYMEYLIFNLHAAASASTPDQPAQTLTGDQLPKPSEYLSAWLQSPLSIYIYGPTQLASERSNLNNSWYSVDDGYKPITEYFTIVEDADGKQSTPDGWPCSKYVQLARQRRILLEYGKMDPQLDGYDEVSNNSVLYPPHYLTSLKDVSTADEGSLGSCFYDEKATTVSQANSSWAESEIPVPAGLDETGTLAEVASMIYNLTACGLSPALNSTLLGASADTDPYSYRNVSLSSSWAWAIGEPKHAASTNDDAPKMDRCAVMDLSLEGHWRAVNCTENTRRVACRVDNGPFTWTIPSNKTTYDGAFKVCPDNSEFAVPRTGLENTYLYRYALSRPKSFLDPASSDISMREVWIDLNSLDIESCWVSGSPEASCPYASDPEQLERRTVLVSVIAGIVIILVTALTFFVKCNANRRNSRRRKRFIEGWEYEGVPS